MSDETELDNDMVKMIMDAGDFQLKCAKVERAALAEFDREGSQWGWKDCKKILRDWFPRLRERASKSEHPDEDWSEYRSEVSYVGEIVDGLRWAFSRNINRTLYDAVQDSIWAWPREWELQYPPIKQWRGNSSPANTEELANKLTRADSGGFHA